MTGNQRVYLALLLHQLPQNRRNEMLDAEIKNLGISEAEIITEREKLLNYFEFGISKLNSKQLQNFLDLLNERKYDQLIVERKLNFFEIEKVYHENIKRFCKDYIQSNEFIDVIDLDREFKGVQVATRDNFNTILNQGWTGDWVVNPENINPKRIQIASMNEEGNFPRGWYIIADIAKIDPVKYGMQIRQRIFISNPQIINTGNRNIRFNINPVNYIS